MKPTSTSQFTLALGLQAPWAVSEGAFEADAGRFELQVSFQPGARFTCSQCGAEQQPVHDTLEREWRHLNFFQYQAYLQAKVPHVGCVTCGKTTQVLWARKGSGFRLLMEALMVTLIKAMPVRQVAQLLAVSDPSIWRILAHYVDNARAQEDFSGVTTIGLDETAAQRGHHYISLFHDLDAGRLLLTYAGRTADVVAPIADGPEAQDGCAENLTAACIDMSTRYRVGLAEHLPWVDVTFDEFHIIQLVNRAVDEVRCQETKTSPTLKRSRYLWLKDRQGWTERQVRQYVDLKRLNLKTHRDFRIKEALRDIFHHAPDRETAEPLLNPWYAWARRCRIEPTKHVAMSLKNHWEGILNAFDAKLTNGRIESINALIQAAKAKARGYGTTSHLIIISYLVAGKFTHLPASPFKLKKVLTIAAGVQGV
jgi:transposase